MKAVHLDRLDSTFGTLNGYKSCFFARRWSDCLIDVSQHFWIHWLVGKSFSGHEFIQAIIDSNKQLTSQSFDGRDRIFPTRLSMTLRRRNKCISLARWCCLLPCCRVVVEYASSTRHKCIDENTRFDKQLYNKVLINWSNRWNHCTVIRLWKVNWQLITQNLPFKRYIFVYHSP